MALNHPDFSNVDDDDPRVITWRVHFAAGTCSDSTATMFENNEETPETALETLTEGNPSPLDEWAAQEAANAIEEATQPATEEEACEDPECDPIILPGDMIIDVEKLDKNPIFNIESPLIQSGIRASLDNLGGCDGAIAEQYYENPDATHLPYPGECLS